MTDLPATTGEGPWLVAPDHPDLAGAAADRINDPERPDRLAWNAFRTLGEWNTDVWVPSLLESALGSDNPLSGLQWGEAEIAMWRTASDRHDMADVVLDGPDAVVLFSCTLAEDVDLDELSRGVQRALDLRRSDGAGAAFVLVVPPAADLERLDDLIVADLVGPEERDGHGYRAEALSKLAGWVTWADLGALALDLAEETDPLRAEQVHMLVTDLQAAFPGVEL